MSELKGAASVTQGIGQHTEVAGAWEGARGLVDCNHRPVDTRSSHPRGALHTPQGEAGVQEQVKDPHGPTETSYSS